MQNIKNAFIYCQKKTKEKHWRTMNGLKKKSNNDMKFKHVNNYIKFYK